MTAIEWTDCTWNPTVGCSRVSAGCMNCFAERMARRLSYVKEEYDGLVTLPGCHCNRPGQIGVRGECSECGRDMGSGAPRWTGEIRCLPERLGQPLRWRKPRRVFVNSMSDLFHEGVPDEFIDEVFAVMDVASHHTFQVLTKRPERMLRYTQREGSAARVRSRVLTMIGPLSPGSAGMLEETWPPSNVWLGVSVENQATADERIPLLLQTPAALRFVSYEPALGPVKFARKWLGQGSHCPEDGWGGGVDEDGCCSACGRDAMWYGLDWVIAGGESGPGARRCNVEWIRSVVQQCRAMEVACFVKQVGANAEWTWRVGSGWHSWVSPDEEGGIAYWRLRLRDRKGGDSAEWPADLRVREFPEAKL